MHSPDIVQPYTPKSTAALQALVALESHDAGIEPFAGVNMQGPARTQLLFASGANTSTARQTDADVALQVVP